jgi:hypothetical protein
VGKGIITEACCNCGELVVVLDPVSGWCYACTPPACLNCGEEFSTYGQHRDLCAKCRRELWDQHNADAIERYMGVGLTLTQARLCVKEENRPKCLCCGEPIFYGNPEKDRFCKRTELCRKAARRYKYYRRDKKLSPELALAQVVQSMTVPTREIV